MHFRTTKSAKTDNVIPLLTQVVDAVHGGAPAGQGQPLHVPPLGPPQGQYSLLGKGIQGERVHTLLVDHHKGLVGPVTNLEIAQCQQKFTLPFTIYRTGNIFY